MTKFRRNISLSHRLRTEVLGLDVVDGAGVGHSAQQLIELLEAAGFVYTYWSRVWNSLIKIFHCF